MSYSEHLGAWPTPNFDRLVTDVVQPPMTATVSGEFAASKRGALLGVVRHPGKVVGVIMSAENAGKNDSQVPTATGYVYINGVSCLSTSPVIAAVSGEAAAHKTTDAEAADTGVTAAVVDHTANDVNRGDVITYTIEYSGNSSPTTKMKNVGLMVEFDTYHDL
jgi:alkylation response protein AidB-like acyl-CoA dehydrogenase